MSGNGKREAEGDGPPCASRSPKVRSSGNRRHVTACAAAADVDDHKALRGHTVELQDNLWRVAGEASRHAQRSIQFFLHRKRSGREIVGDVEDLNGRIIRSDKAK